MVVAGGCHNSVSGFLPGCKEENKSKKGEVCRGLLKQLW
jgi:hypothetical protein